MGKPFGTRQIDILKLLSVFMMELYSESYAGFRSAMLAEGRARIRAGVPRETCTSENRTVSIFKIGEPVSFGQKHESMPWFVSPVPVE